CSDIFPHRIAQRSRASMGDGAHTAILLHPSFRGIGYELLAMAFARFKIAEQQLWPHHGEERAGSDRGGMVVTWEFGQDLLAVQHSLLVEAEEQQRQHLQGKNGEVRIESEPIAGQFAPAGIAVLLGLLQTFNRLTVLPCEELYRRKHPVANRSVDRIFLTVGNLHNLASQPKRGLAKLGGHVVSRAKAIEHSEALQIGADAGIEKLLR